MTSAEEDYLIVNAVLTGILILPVLIIWIISLFRARRHKDPARNGVLWLKLPHHFFLFLIIGDAADGTYIAIVSGYYTSDLVPSTTYLSLVANFLEMVASVFTFIAMVELVLGFWYILKAPQNAGANNDADKDAHVVHPENSHTTAARAKIIRIVTAFFGVVLVVLAIALLGNACSSYSKYYRNAVSAENPTSDSAESDYDKVLDTYEAAIKISRDRSASFGIILWILGFPLVGAAGYLVHQARLQAQPVLGAAVLFLVATIAWFVRFTWHLVYNAAWLLPSSSSHAPFWFNIADPILNTWLFFIALVLLHVIVTRRARGLWSTAQPWMQPLAPPAGMYNPAVGYPPAGYAEAPASSVSPHQVYQMPNHEQQQYQPHVFHEMPPNNLVYEMQQPPANPQEMYAPAPQNYMQQQYQGHPQGTLSQISAQPTGSTAIHPSPPPVSGDSGTPPNDLKA